MGERVFKPATHSVYNAGVRQTAVLLAALTCAAAAWSADLRLGIIGTDTSHVGAFTKLLNDPNAKGYIPGARVVAAYKGGSKDVESSISRVDKYAQELTEKWGVEIVPDIKTLLGKVDAILLESVDGRPHLAQAKEVIAAGKPLFIDKPLASTYEDAKEIARLAKAAGVPWFSASSLRWGQIPETMTFPDANAVITWGPSPFEEHQQLDLTWYGIHAVEMLYTLIGGAGCEEVTRVVTPNSDMVTGRWKNGKMGSVQLLRPYAEFGAVVFRGTAKNVQVVQSPAKPGHDYRPLLVEIVKFFQTKQTPVPNAETLEIFAFMDAAQRSKAAGGAPMKIR